MSNTPLGGVKKQKQTNKQTKKYTTAIIAVDTHTLAGIKCEIEVGYQAFLDAIGTQACE